jgi:hypothetical protein
LTILSPTTQSAGPEQLTLALEEVKVQEVVVVWNLGNRWQVSDAELVVAMAFCESVRLEPL